MSWEDATPVVPKIVHNCRASVSILADGRSKIMLSFSDPFYREMGEPRTLIIQCGAADKLGLVRLVPDPHGKFVVNEMEKGGARVYLSLPPTMPKRERDVESCEVIDRPVLPPPSSDTEKAALPLGAAWVIKLPMDAWAAQSVPKPVVPTKPKEDAPAPGAHTSTRRLNAADYLKKNGIGCNRLAGDWWQIQGVKVTRLEVLSRVNEIRRRADLPMLGLEDIE